MRSARAHGVIGPLLPAWVAVLALLVGAPARGDTAIALKVSAVHVGDGRVLRDATVVVVEGRIQAVGSDVDVPAGAEVIEVPTGTISPGLIDANAFLEPADLMPTPAPDARRALGSWLTGGGRHLDGHLALPDTTATDISYPGRLMSTEHLHEPGDPVCALCGGGAASYGPPTVSGVRASLSVAEQSEEVIPYTRVIDAVNLHSPDFARLLSGGVTTVFVAPDAGAVISSRGAIVRTGGLLDRRIIRDVDAVKAVIGTEPSWRGGSNRPPRYRNVTMYTRRPSNRMGLTWVFRKAFYDADRFARGVEVHGADVPTPEAMAVLGEIREGTIPLRIQARMLHDITTAIRLADEFGLTFTLEEATEAYKCVDVLKDRAIPVIYGPIYESASPPRAWTGEVNEARLFTIRALVEAGVETALSAQERRDEDGLARQAMMAMRAGVSPADALRMVTSTPARMLGLDADVGTVEVGKHADLVVWTGEPMGATSRPLVVLIDGRIVLDRRG